MMFWLIIGLYVAHLYITGCNKVHLCRPNNTVVVIFCRCSKYNTWHLITCNHQERIMTSIIGLELRMEALQRRIWRVWCGEGVPLRIGERVLEAGTSAEFFFNFEVSARIAKCVFWCILRPFWWIWHTLNIFSEKKISNFPTGGPIWAVGMQCCTQCTADCSAALHPQGPLLATINSFTWSFTWCGRTRIRVSSDPMRPWGLAD